MFQAHSVVFFFYTLCSPSVSLPLTKRDLSSIKKTVCISVNHLPYKPNVRKLDWATSRHSGIGFDGPDLSDFIYREELSRIAA